MSTDHEITLQHGRARVAVSPLGASLRRFTLETADGPWNVIWGYEGASAKKAGQGDVLIPFPSRVKGGRYVFGGQAYQMALNDKEGPNAIHGFLRTETWQHQNEGHDAATFHFRMRPEQFAARGYPFALDVEVRYTLNERGLRPAFVFTTQEITPRPWAWASTPTSPWIHAPSTPGRLHSRPRNILNFRI
ncbi:MAG: hypothetical protein HC902_14670 [Calothrix sp. SM1_5_4]|nr:hypothetical protein [Calothrix sp. SM1_5_4]